MCPLAEMSKQSHPKKFPSVGIGSFFNIQVDWFSPDDSQCLPFNTTNALGKSLIVSAVDIGLIIEVVS
jgi:hypothetical protein